MFRAAANAKERQRARYNRALTVAAPFRDFLSNRECQRAATSSLSNGPLFDTHGSALALTLTLRASAVESACALSFAVPGDRCTIPILWK